VSVPLFRNQVDWLLNIVYQSGNRVGWALDLVDLNAGAAVTVLLNQRLMQSTQTGVVELLIAIVWWMMFGPVAVNHETAAYCLSAPARDLQDCASNAIQA
jgi:hypothetical protein